MTIFLVIAKISTQFSYQSDLSYLPLIAKLNSSSPSYFIFPGLNIIKNYLAFHKNKKKFFFTLSFHISKNT